jgi:hypothetical protein
MKEMLGYDCKVLKLEDSEAQSKELGLKFKTFAEQYK